MGADQSSPINLAEMGLEGITCGTGGAINLTPTFNAADDVNNLLHELASVRLFTETAFVQYHIFLQPGRIIYAEHRRGETTYEVFKKAQLRADNANKCILLGHFVRVEFLDPFSLKMWYHDSCKPLQPEDKSSSGESESKENERRRRGESNMDADLLIKESTFLKSLHRKDVATESLNEKERTQCYHMKFHNAGAAKVWGDSILEESQRLQLSHLVFHEHAAASEAFGCALQRGIMNLLCENSACAPLQKLYFSSLETTGSCLLFLHFYGAFFSFVPAANWENDLPLFLHFLATAAEDVAVRCFVIGFQLNADLFGSFKEYLAALVTEGSAVEGAERGIGLFVRESVISGFRNKYPACSADALDFVEFVEYLRCKANVFEWSAGRALLCKLLGYPYDSTHADCFNKAVMNWYKDLKQVYAITFQQLQLMLEPTPFTGFFFVDYFVNSGDYVRAREVVLKLPFDLSQRFAAVYSSSDEVVVAAHFIGYLEWDSLQRGYEEFELKNKDNEAVLEMIGHSRAMYNAPLVTTSSLDLLSMNQVEIQENCMTQLLHGAESESIPEIKVLRQICLNWMLHTRSSTGILSTPRKAHFISFLCIINWFNWHHDTHNLHSRDNLHFNSLQNHLIYGLADEGEDQGLLKAMATVYFAKVRSKSCHILYLDHEAMLRDFSRLSPFLEMFGLTCTMNDFTVPSDVTFCMLREQCQYYRDCVFQGVEPLKQSILVCDDLDGARLDKLSHTMFGKRDDEMNAFFKDYFDLYVKYGEGAAPAKRGDFNEVCWQKAKQAFSMYSAMQEGKPNGYAKVNGRYELLDARGKVVEHKYHLGLEMHRYVQSGEWPSINSKFFYQSLVHVFSKYEAIVAFGDSDVAPALRKGAAASRNFVLKMFGAVFFNVPNDEFQALSSMTRLNNVIRADYDSIAQATGPVAADMGSAPRGSDAQQVDFGNIYASEKTSSPLLRRRKGSQDDGASNQVSNRHVTALRGIQLSELCEKFYLKYPQPAGNVKWPSVRFHRDMVAFLDDDRRHNIDGIVDFAVQVGLVPAAKYYVSSYTDV